MNFPFGARAIFMGFCYYFQGGYMYDLGLRSRSWKTKLNCSSQDAGLLARQHQDHKGSHETCRSSIRDTNLQWLHPGEMHQRCISCLYREKDEFYQRYQQQTTDPLGHPEFLLLKKIPATHHLGGIHKPVHNISSHYQPLLLCQIFRIFLSPTAPDSPIVTT